ncbi:hypothetical protein TNCV_4534431 [Trichonephila clavipes]|nr:hypothetical protein TNCV_4534431 [Trichonephila clavipes]
MMPDRGPRNSSWQRARCTPAVGRSFEHHTDDSTFWLGSTLILWKNTLLVSGPPPLFLFHQPHERTCGSMAFRSSCRKTLYIYKNPSLLRDSNPDTTEQKSAALTTIPDREVHISYSG